MDDELLGHLLAPADVDGGFGELDLGHGLQDQPGDLIGQLIALGVHAADGDVGQQGAGSGPLLSGDRDQVFAFADLQPQSAQQFGGVLSGHLAGSLVGGVVGIEDLVQTAHRHLRPVGGFLPADQMVQADALYGLEEIPGRLGGAALAGLGDAQQFPGPLGIGGLRLLPGQIGVTLGVADESLAGDDAGLQQPEFPQELSGAMAVLVVALGHHPLPFLPAELDDVVQAHADALVADLGDAAAIGGVVLEEAPVHGVADAAALEDHAPVEEQVKGLLPHLEGYGGVDGADLGHMVDPVQRVLPQGLQVLRRDLGGGGVAGLAVEFAAFNHLQDLVGLHGAEGAVAPDEFGQAAGQQFPVPQDDGALVQPLLKGLGPADIHRQALGLLPGFSEQQRIVHVDLGLRVLPLLLQLLQTGRQHLHGLDLRLIDCGVFVRHLFSPFPSADAGRSSRSAVLQFSS